MTTPLRAWRKRLGLSQLALAERLGVTKSTAAGWEQGRSQPPPYLWLALAAIEAALPPPPEAG